MKEKKCIFCDNTFTMFENGQFVEIPHEKRVWFAHANCIIDSLTTVKRFTKIQDAIQDIL